MSKPQFPKPEPSAILTIEGSGRPSEKQLKGPNGTITVRAFKLELETRVEHIQTLLKYIQHLEERIDNLQAQLPTSET